MKKKNQNNKNKSDSKISKTIKNMRKEYFKLNKRFIAKNGFNITEVIILIIIGILIGAIFTMALYSKKSSMYTKVDDNLQTLVDTYNEIKNNYYDDVDEKTVVDGGVKGMLDAVGDPYTTMLDYSSSNNFNITIQGHFSGLGLEISQSDNKIIVSGIFKDSGASAADLKLGDEILSIDDKKSSEISTSEFSEYVRNAEKDNFDLIISREGKELNVNVKRKEVVLKSVSSKIIETNGKKVGYIYVSIFALNTYDQFKEAFDNLKQQGMDSLIIDLRDNTGGELSCASKMISLFLSKEKVMYQIADKTSSKNVYSSGSSDSQYKIVLLVNENSASASEIMTAALKENLNCIIVGQKTFGKGTVQNLFQTSTGQEYKITSKKWLTPNGTWINQQGISPDVSVKMSSDYYKTPSDKSDNQLQEAIKQAKEN